MNNNKSNGETTFSFVGRLEPTPEINTTTVPETIKLIAGKFNNYNTVCYWNIDEDMDFKIGDYAIVENKNDYDLVKIVGVVETTEKYEKFISNCNVSKKVVSIISRDEIRED